VNKFDRIQQLHAILEHRRTPVSLPELMEDLECGEATVKRLIAKFRHEFDAPVVYNRTHNGYRLERQPDTRYEVPGLWFTVAELHALLTIHELLAHLQPGILKSELSTFCNRIKKILASRGLGESELLTRIRICRIAGRPALPAHFNQAAKATLERIQLKIQYYGRSSNTLTSRTISPQRMVHYRENWYLDGWCHTTEALRIFSVDRLQSIEPLKIKARDIPAKELDNHFMPAYGLFAGAATATAKLRFTPERARWVADEQWHPEQHGEWCADGSYILSLPYSDHRELLLDILKYGPDVEVLAPPEVRGEVKKRLLLALKKYE